MIFNDYTAVIKVRKELSPDEKLKTLIHEMLHLVFRDSHDVVLDNLEEYTRTIYNRFNERAIEQLAKSIYKLISYGG